MTRDLMKQAWLRLKQTLTTRGRATAREGAETATARAKEMGEKVKKLLKKAAAQVSIVPRHPHKQNVTKETKKKFDEIDPVRVDTSSLIP